MKNFDKDFVYRTKINIEDKSQNNIDYSVTLIIV